MAQHGYLGAVYSSQCCLWCCDACSVSAVFHSTQLHPPVCAPSTIPFWMHSHCQSHSWYNNAELQEKFPENCFDFNAVVLVYSCLASSTQTTVGFAQFAHCWCFCFCLHFSLNKQFWKYFHSLQYALVQIVLPSYHCCHALAVQTINIQEENPREGADLSYSYSLCNHKGTWQYKTRESTRIWMNRRGGSETERAGSALMSIKTTLETTV